MKNVQEQYKKYLNSGAGASRYNAIKKFWYGPSDSLVPRIYAVLRKELTSRKTIRILDVGGGDGKRLRALMRLMKNDGIAVDATLVEPSAAFVGVARKYKGYTVVHSLFENFSAADTFDLVLFIHSIYTFTDDRYIKKARRYLRPSGAMFFVSNRPGSFLSGLKRLLDQRFVAKRREIHQVVQDLESNGMDTEVRFSRTRFRSLLDRGELTKAGKWSIGWLALAPFQTLPQSIVDRVMNYLRRHEKDGYMADTEMFVIAKKLRKNT